VGVAAMLIACKYEEIYPPELKDFVYITDRAYTKEDVLQMEFLILSTLSFDLNFPTALRFLERYMRMLGEDSDIITFSQFLMELALVDVRMLQYPSSILAAAALSEAYKKITRKLYPNRVECEKKIDAYMRDSLNLAKENSGSLLLCSKELHFL
jgi:hypothetical protein